MPPSPSHVGRRPIIAGRSRRWRRRRRRRRLRYNFVYTRTRCVVYRLNSVVGFTVAAAIITEYGGVAVAVSDKTYGLPVRRRAPPPGHPITRYRVTCPLPRIGGAMCGRSHGNRPLVCVRVNVTCTVFLNTTGRNDTIITDGHITTGLLLALRVKQT